MINETLGFIVIILGISVSVIGNIAYFCYKEFFSELLIATIIDTAGFSLILIGVIIYMGVSFFSLKIFMILLLSLTINPIMSCALGQSAYRSGFKPLKQEEVEDV